MMSLIHLVEVQYVFICRFRVSLENRELLVAPETVDPLDRLDLLDSLDLLENLAERSENG